MVKRSRLRKTKRKIKYYTLADLDVSSSGLPLVPFSEFFMKRVILRKTKDGRISITEGKPMVKR